MVDSKSMGVGAEMTPRLTDLAVMPEPRGEGEQAQGDPGTEAGQGASAVALQPELALAGPEHRLDPLADPPQRAEAGSLVLAVRPEEGGSAEPHELLELPPGEALVRDHGVAGERHPLEHLAGDVPLGGIGGGELEGDRGAVCGAEQVEPKAPEVARVRAAVAVAGVAGEL